MLLSPLLWILLLPAAEAPPATPGIEVVSVQKKEPSKKRRSRKKRGPPRVVPPLEPFAGELDEVKRLALERNVPIVCFMALEGEEASDRFRDGILPNEAVRAACLEVIVLACNNGVHELETVTEEVDGKPSERRMCPLYRTPTCTDHQRSWDEIYFQYSEDGELAAPQVIVLDPKAKLFERLSNRDVPAVSDVVKSIEEAQTEAGPGISMDQLREIRSRLTPARHHTETKNWTAAWRAWQGMLDVSEHGLYAEEARKGLETARNGVSDEIDAYFAEMVPGSAARAWERLQEMLLDVEGLPPEKPLKKRIQKAERDPKIKDEIVQHKRELEARALWHEAKDLFIAGERKKAERVVRRLLKNKKLIGTASYAEALAAHPELAPKAK